MVPCVHCGQLAVSRDDPPRYDVFNDGPVTGPYCPTCWPDTVSGQLDPQT